MQDFGTTSTLPKGQSGIVTFGLKKGYEAGKKVAEQYRDCFRFWRTLEIPNP